MCVLFLRRPKGQHMSKCSRDRKRVKWSGCSFLRSTRQPQTGAGIRTGCTQGSTHGCTPPPVVAAFAEASIILDRISLPPCSSALFSHRVSHAFGSLEAHGVLFGSVCGGSSGQGIIQLVLASRSRPRIERWNEYRRSVLLPADSRTLLVT